MKILVIRSGAVGDVIMATPFLRNLREAYPNSRISFLVGKWSKEVLRNNKNIDEIISFDDKIIARKKFLEVLALSRKIKIMNFDRCFILDKSWAWSLFAFICGIRKRIGFSSGTEASFNTISINFDGKKQESEYNNDLLTVAGIKAKNYQPEIFSTEKDIEFAERVIFSVGFNKIIVGIAPGGAVNPGQSAILKRWPIDRYKEFVGKIGVPCILLGNSNDKVVCKEIMASHETGTYDATGISIQKAKEIMERCAAVITHDSGAMHIASATSTKIIALFGPTPAERFAPKNAVVIRTKSWPCYTISGKF